MFNYLLLAGIVIGLGFLIGKGTHFLKITSIVGYIFAGILLGPDFLGVVKDLPPMEAEVLTSFALGFVAFIIGGELTFSLLRRMGRGIIAIILGESLGAFVLVFVGIYLLTGRLPEALIFAAMAPASAPTGTVAVLHEYRARGRLTNALLAVVGFDDGFAILIYAFSIAVVGLLLGSSGMSSLSALVVNPIVEIGGAVFIGSIIGILFAVVLKNLVEREEIIAVALVAILLTAGISLFLGFSLILSCMVMGMIVINIFPQANRPVFEHIRSISLPIYILFFVVAGLNLHIKLLAAIGLLGVVYIVCRSVGLIGGSYFAALMSKADPVIRNNLGLGILSQAGVAIGLALLASHKLSSWGMPEMGSMVITTIAATTIVFEIIGPLAARFAIIRAGEAKRI
ncbi:MAG: cation:proton antiporter [Thermoplasmata archaeon]|nr:MAG: cation:proton antiporter [Thermoplasmata archaeon]RLF34466.1 MAG: cation:proton antiporter [Thermoplasmata archaeon]